MNFPYAIFFEIIYDIFRVWSNFIKIFFNWQCFISITITFIFNIIITPKITYCYWLLIIFFFFMFKKVSYISNYSVSIALIFIFQSKKFLISRISLFLIALFSFFSLKRFLTSPLTLFLIALFSFFSLKRLLISLIVVSFSCFLVKNISYISNYVIFYFSSFSSLELFIFTYCEK